jgi:GNAT superfamily N-acetyltransferase
MLPSKRSMKSSVRGADVTAVFHPLTADRWTDLEALFGARGACGGCWCMTWRLPRARFEEGKGAGNRAAFRRRVRSGPPPGVLAYVEDEPAGWCAVAPRTEYEYLSRSRVLRPIDDRAVWSVSCLFVAKSYRGRGLSVRLLRAGVEMAREAGARIVEGYPVIPYASRMPDAFAWTGTLTAFRAAGFEEVARGSPKRPIMRIEPSRTTR